VQHDGAALKGDLLNGLVDGSSAHSYGLRVVGPCSD
jgi:hypothetical protein